MKKAKLRDLLRKRELENEKTQISVVPIEVKIKAPKNNKNKKGDK